MPMETVRPSVKQLDRLAASQQQDEKLEEREEAGVGGRVCI